MSTLNTPNDTTDLAPSDDFGAAVLAEFQRREFGTGGAAMASDDAPPGGWPDGAIADAMHLADDTSTSTSTDVPDPRAATRTAENADQGDGEADLPAVTEGGDASLDMGSAVTDTSVASADPAGDDGPPAGSSGSAQEPPSTETAPETPPATDPATTDASGYVWNDGDTPHTFSDEQVQRGLVLNAWAEGLPEQTRASFAAIEAGQAVAIARAEFDQFQAWRETQTRSTRDADLERLGLDADDPVVQLIGGLRDEIAALKGTGAPTSTSTSTSPLAASAQDFQGTVNSNLDATAQRLDAGARAYATSRGLSEPELDALFNAAVAAQVIPALAENLAIKNPATGMVIQPADPALVIEQALDFALIRNPALHTAVVQRQATAPAQPPAPVDAAITAKKARAASVASAPSAAVTPPRSTQGLTPQEQVNAMAAELAAAMGSQ